MKLTKKEQTEVKKLVMPLLDDLNRLACYLCNNRADAEDLVADTVRKGCESFRSLKDHQKIKQWMTRILRNTFVSKCRSYKNYTFLEYDDGHDHPGLNFSLFSEVSQPFLMWWGNPERELVNKLLEEDIRNAISALPPTYRFAVVLRDLEDLSYEEISVTLDIPVGTVRSRIARGRSILQKELYHHAVERGIIQTRSSEHE